MPESANRPPQSADELIALLRLSPHPEGGYYRETFCDAGAFDQRGRAASTAIYFLLKAGEVSRWHRFDATEVWHWYAGSPLELSFVAPTEGARVNSVRLGNSIASGERPQAVVPANFWQKARSLGEFTLVGCTAAPGFTFDGFELASDDFSPGAADS